MLTFTMEQIQSHLQNIDLTKNQKWVIGGTLAIGFVNACTVHKKAKNKNKNEKINYNHNNKHIKFNHRLLYLTYKAITRNNGSSVSDNNKNDKHPGRSPQSQALYDEAIKNGAKQFNATRSDIDCATLLGECPIWDDERELLLFLDIDRSLLHEYNPVTNELNPNPHKFNQRPGSFALCNSNISPDCYLMAMEDGLYFYNFKQRKLSKNILIGAGKGKGKGNNAVGSVAGELYMHLKNHPKIRLNDGRCDRDGNFIVGGMVEDFWDGMDFDAPYIVNFTKFLYRINTREASCIWRVNGNDLSCDKLVSYVYLSNSICFSLDGNKMYFTDTLKSVAGNPRINRIDEYNAKGNNNDECIEDMFSLIGREPKTLWTRKCYAPDGSCIDSDDCLWSAHNGDYTVCRYDKNGNLDIIVNVAEKMTTCMAFGGKNLDTLYITTLNEKTFRGDKRTEEDKRNPKEGFIYQIKIPNVKGTKESRFNGDCKEYF